MQKPTMLYPFSSEGLVVPLQMNTTTSRDQSKPTRIEENVVKYNRRYRK